MTASKVEQYLNDNIPENDLRSFYSTLSTKDLKAIRSGNTKDFTPSGLKRLSDANDYINSANKKVNAPLSRTQQFGKNNPFLGHVAADLATSGGNIANSMASIAGLPEDPTNYDNEYGVKPTVYDKVATTVLPFALAAPLGGGAAGIATKGMGLAEDTVKGAKLLASGATGGALSSPDNPEQGAIGGVAGAGVGSAVGAGATKVASKVAKPLLSWIGRMAQSDMAEKVAAPLIDAKNRFSGYGQAAKAIYDDSMGKFFKNHSIANDTAKALDQKYAANGVRLNPAAYANKLTGFVDDVNSLTPVQQEPYETAKEFAMNELNSNHIPTNFQDTVQLHKNLNQSLSNFINKYNKTPGDVESSKLISGLKGTLRNNLLAPNSNVPEIGQIKNALESGNANYATAQGAANIPTAAGGLVKNRAVMATLKAGDTPLEAKANAFITKNPQAFEQIAKTLKTSPVNLTKRLIANNVLDSDNNVNVNELLKRYGNLTDEQKGKIFSKKDMDRLSVLQSTKAVTREVGGDKYRRVAVYGLPVLGAGLGFEKGGVKGAAVGAGAGFAGDALISRLFSSPKVIAWLLKDEAPKGVSSFKKSGLGGALIGSNTNSKGN